MESREQRIATLAATLKSSGIAKSDAQAKMMAEDMVGVEEHVQKSYEERHAQANDYLQTAKNLGNPRPKAPTDPRPNVRIEGSRMIDPIEPASKSDSPKYDSPKSDSSRSETPKIITKEISYAETDISFKGKTLNDAFAADKNSHDTHNAALEAIKNSISQGLTEADDEPQFTQNHVSKEAVMKDVDEMLQEPISNKETIQQDQSEKASEQQKDASPSGPAPLIEEIPTESDEGIEEPTLDDEVEIPQEIQSQAQTQTELQSPKLDSAKLVEMMEEDGKLEEHTREIKEKPKDVKPKEAYAENSIDLSSVFSFNKK